MQGCLLSPQNSYLNAQAKSHEESTRDAKPYISRASGQRLNLEWPNHAAGAWQGAWPGSFSQLESRTVLMKQREGY